MKTKSKGFTLIELLVVISIISLLSSVVLAAVTKTRIKARDAQRIQNARQLALALEQYETTYNTYKISGAGLNSNNGSGYATKGTGDSGYTTSIASALKSVGMYNALDLIDPIFGEDNYYIGLCTTTNAYNIFVKLEQSQYQNATTSISNSCGGAEAANLGFSYIGATVGGTSGGGTGIAGSYEVGMMPGGGDISFNGLIYKEVVAEDGRTWLDRNLGATQVAAAFNDAASYGYYYQWGRGTDGHQTSTSLSTSTLLTNPTITHNKFVFITVGPFDWISPQVNTLWQGVSGTNNPCPSGFRIPTISEWQSWVTALGGFSASTCGLSNNCRQVALNSILKIPSSGYRSAVNASIAESGTYGCFWSSSFSGLYSYTISWNSSNVNPSYSNEARAIGHPIRCIKD